MICGICKKEFEPHHFNQKYCCDECKKEAIRQTKARYKKHATLRANYGQKDTKRPKKVLPQKCGGEIVSRKKLLTKGIDNLKKGVRRLSNCRNDTLKIIPKRENENVRGTRLMHILKKEEPTTTWQ